MLNPPKIPDHSCFSTKYQNTFINLFLFELSSFLGRSFQNKKLSIRREGTNLLNLGCANTCYKDWINADFFRLRFWINSPPKPDWMLDLRYPLNCDDAVWDGVFTEHTLEHLYPQHSFQLLTEIFRTLKPGGWLRISVPDLEKYVQYYTGKVPDEEFRKWDTGCEAIRALTQNWGHLSLYDQHLLKALLITVGFINVRVVDFQHGADKRLFKEQPERKWESLYMEAQKP